jgi:hypothetical protein
VALVTRSISRQWLIAALLCLAGVAAADSLRTATSTDSLLLVSDSTFALSDSVIHAVGPRAAWLYPFAIIVLSFGAVVALFTIRSK